LAFFLNWDKTNIRAKILLISTAPKAPVSRAFAA